MPIRRSFSAARLVIPTLVCVALMYLNPACRQDRDADSVDPQAEAAKQESAELLVFPDELRVADPSVNDFVERAMAGCGSGDYDRFRLLWSVREDPLPRDDYLEGWQAVLRIKIRALEKVMLSPDPKLGRERPEIAYAILADVALDPERPAGRREPHRQVVLTVIREQMAWRLAGAPSALRTWIKQRVHQRQSDGVELADDRSSNAERD